MGGFLFLHYIKRWSRLNGEKYLKRKKLFLLFDLLLTEYMSNIQSSVQRNQNKMKQGFVCVHVLTAWKSSKIGECNWNMNKREMWLSEIFEQQEGWILKRLPSKKLKREGKNDKRILWKAGKNAEVMLLFASKKEGVDGFPQPCVSFQEHAFAWDTKKCFSAHLNPQSSYTSFRSIQMLPYAGAVAKKETLISRYTFLRQAGEWLQCWREQNLLILISYENRATKKKHFKCLEHFSQEKKRGKRITALSSPAIVPRESQILV